MLMADIIDNFLRTNSSGLATLLSASTPCDFRSPEELRESLVHLFSIPIESALNQLPRNLAATLRQTASEERVASAAQEAGIGTFGELFRHPRPPLGLLRFAKNFGKGICRGKCVWPRKVGEVLNYASYAAALMVWNERIGNLGRDDLQKGFRQLAERRWVDEALKALFKESGEKLLRRGASSSSVSK
jgi:hypothetical protein